MAQAAFRLCEQCQSLDIRALLLAADQQDVVVPDEYRNTDALVRPGLKRFCLLHENLPALRDCANSGACELCTMIWTCYVTENGIAVADTTDEELCKELGDGSIHIGTTDWNLANGDLPRLLVELYGSTVATFIMPGTQWTTSRRLACFDVCVPYG